MNYCKNATNRQNNEENLTQILLSLNKYQVQPRVRFSKRWNSVIIYSSVSDSNSAESVQLIRSMRAAVPSKIVVGKSALNYFIADSNYHLPSKLRRLNNSLLSQVP